VSRTPPTIATPSADPRDSPGVNISLPAATRSASKRGSEAPRSGNDSLPRPRGSNLALALIGEDLGEGIARRAAQQLVVYHRRPGGQSQFSPLLEIERIDGRFTALLEHVRANLHRRLSIVDLASYCCMSPRNFSRLFTSEAGLTPAKAVERLRVDTARAALESGMQSVQEVARQYGFENPERMRRSFVRLLGTAPSRMKR
jgi:transcriptional regulator GlxA family with amidase domain